MREEARRRVRLIVARRPQWAAMLKEAGFEVFYVKVGLDDAEDIVNAVEADALSELDTQKRPRRWWQRRKRGDGDDGPFRLSQR